jgi:hypothetical protein
MYHIEESGKLRTLVTELQRTSSSFARVVEVSPRVSRRESSRLETGGHWADGRWFRGEEKLGPMGLVFETLNFGKSVKRSELEEQ